MKDCSVRKQVSGGKYKELEEKIRDLENIGTNEYQQLLKKLEHWSRNILRFWHVNKC